MYMAGFSGLGKSQAETTFDNGRARLWRQFEALHAQIDPLIANGTITGSQLASAAGTVAGLIAQHKALFAQGQKADIPTSWLDPRYADYEKPMEQYLADLQVRAAGAGVTTPTTPVFQTTPDTSMPTQLIISGGNAPAAGIPGAASTSAPGGGAGVFSDLFGPPAPVAAAPAGFFGEMGPMLPWIAGGLFAAYFLSRK
jgi:hypothetical protein